MCSGFISVNIIQTWVYFEEQLENGISIGHITALYSYQPLIILISRKFCLQTELHINGKVQYTTFSGWFHIIWQCAVQILSFPF